MSKQKNKSAEETEFSDNLKFHLLKALDSNPNFSEAHLQLALIYEGNRAHKTAETHFRRALDSDSKEIHEIEKKGQALLKKFQFQNANILFMKVQDKKYHCAKVNIKLSDYYVNQNQLSKAQTCLKNSITLAPTSSKAHRNLGILYFKQKCYGDAKSYIEKALELDYTDCLSHLNMGMIMRQRNNYDDAEQHFLIALDINPNFVVCMLEMAELQLIIKNQIKAKKYYQKARAISPDIKCKSLDKVKG